jgi:peptidoglycan/xylan/chitin deacetylase (PgdA/CDA1 family)
MPSVIVGAVLASAIVIGLGVLYALPPYLKAIESSQKVPEVLLSLSITSDQNMPDWCRDIADFVNNNHLKAVVFFSGEVAEQYPECVRDFSADVDIGSSTYSYEKLSAERDYLNQLEDIRKGKAVIDSIAGINSKVFKAPHGYTDDNIYSLLSRNGITADFSREGSFNRFDNEKFIFNELKTFKLSNSSADEIETELSHKGSDQIQITADNSMSAEEITSLVARILDNHDSSFTNASDLTALNLTSRDL